MFNIQVFFITRQVTLLLLLLSVITGCTTQKSSTSTAPELQQLRITNSGNADILGLVVLFPGPSSDAEATRVEFGDIPAGQTTEYQNVLGGVYSYAAYEYILNGRVEGQSVIDWVGESPMVGKKFTYQIALDVKKVVGNQVNLITVMVDEP
jgi:hypothetical protein